MFDWGFLRWYGQFPGFPGTLGLLAGSVSGISRDPRASGRVGFRDFPGPKGIWHAGIRQESEVHWDTCASQLNFLEILFMFKQRFRIGRFELIVCVVLFVSTLVLYAPILGHSLLANDFLDLEHTFSISSFSRMAIAGYRPLNEAVYALDSAVYGPERAWGWYLTNILFHLACTAAMGVLLFRLGFSRISCLVGAGIFALSSAGPSTVAVVSGRTTMVAMLPLLIAFILHIKWMRNGRKLNLIFAMFLFLVSLLSKETALACPLAFATISAFLASSARVRSFLRTFVLYLIPLAVYAVIRISSVGLAVSYAESTTFGFFMLNNILSLSRIPISPFLSNLPLRVLFLVYVIGIWLLPIKRSFKFMIPAIGVILLLTVSNIGPRPYYAYACLPAWAILFASVAESMNRKISFPIFFVVLGGIFLNSFDQVRILNDASCYVENTMERMIELDRRYSDSGPIFISGIDFSIGNFSTFWPGAYTEALSTCGYVPDHTILNADKFWEVLYPAFPSDSNITAHFVYLGYEYSNAAEFQPSDRLWNMILPDKRIRISDNGIVSVSDSLSLYNSCWIAGEDISDIKLSLPCPFDPCSLCVIEPFEVRLDTCWFDLEYQYAWVLGSEPFSIGFNCPSNRNIDFVTFSSERLWIEPLEQRIADKLETLSNLEN
jgi:hypothetical protein